MPVLSTALRNYLKSSKLMEPRVLFQIETNLGDSSPLVLRYSTDNASIIYDGVTWSPYPVETQDFIQRINDGSNLLEMTMFDPEDVNLPGPIKQLLQYENILGRSIFKLYLVFMDEIPGGGGAKFYEDTQHTVKLYEGRLDTATVAEDAVAFNLENVVDTLNAEIPKITYSSTCPYSTGDKNCTRLNASFPAQQSRSMNLAYFTDEVTCRITSSPYSPDLPAINTTDYWLHGIIIFNTGNLKGVVRTIVACNFIPFPVVTDAWDLVLDEPIYGAVGNINIQCYLKANCTRTFLDCKNRFKNEANFGGFQSVVKVVGNYTVPRRR